MTEISTEKRVGIFFNRLAHSSSFPVSGSLSEKLNKMVGRAPGADRLPVRTELISDFASAAVEIWQRGIHSFLTSAALTETSPLWASVGGYSASHYSVRGLAHLLGAFQLHQR